MRGGAPGALGATFDTIGPAPPRKEGLRTSYEVVLAEENRRSEITLTDSNVTVFSSKQWRFELAPDHDGVWVTFEVEHQLRGMWRALAPALVLMKGAVLRDLGRDLGQLKDELEHARGGGALP